MEIENISAPHRPQAGPQSAKLEKQIPFRVRCQALFGFMEAKPQSCAPAWVWQAHTGLTEEGTSLTCPGPNLQTHDQEPRPGTSVPTQPLSETHWEGQTHRVTSVNKDRSFPTFQTLKFSNIPNPEVKHPCGQLVKSTRLALLRCPPSISHPFPSKFGTKAQSRMAWKGK